MPAGLWASFARALLGGALVFCATSAMAADSPAEPPVPSTRSWPLPIRTAVAGGLAAQGGMVVLSGEDDAAEEEDKAALNAAADAAHLACEARDFAACSELGDAYSQGRGRLRNRSVAELLYRAACDADEAEACNKLGTILLRHDSEGERRDESQDERQAAEQAFSTACLALILPACEAAADLRDRLNPFSSGPRPGDMVRRFACHNGEQSACRRLAIHLAAPGRTSFAQAEGRARLEALCRAGDAEACSIMSTAGTHAAGEGIPPEPEPADMPAEAPSATTSGTFAAERDACDRGDIDACYSVAGMLLDLDPSTSVGEVVQIHRIAERTCASHWHLVCVGFAQRMIEDEGVPKGRERGYAILDLACQQGEWRACSAFAVLADFDPDAPLLMADAGFPPPDSPDREEDTADRLIPDDTTQCRDIVTTNQGQISRRVMCTVPKVAGPTFCREHIAEFRGLLYFDRFCGRRSTIVGGHVVKPGLAPWQALIWRRDGQVQCGGALIAEGWILTAAHCVVVDGKPIDRASFSIRLGVSNPAAPEGIRYPIREIHWPSFYIAKIDAFDVALLRYDPAAGRREGSVGTIRPIRLDPLSTQERPIRPLAPAFVYGWGWTSLTGGTPTSLRAARVLLVGLDDCTKETDFKRPALRNAALCATAGDGQACHADSGGPLVTWQDTGKGPTLIGILSRSANCGQGQRERPSRFTRISRVVNWITRTMGRSP